MMEVFKVSGWGNFEKTVNKNWYLGIQLRAEGSGGAVGAWRLNGGRDPRLRRAASAGAFGTIGCGAFAP